MDWIQPMDPLLSNQAVDKTGWIHQIKWDGIRGLCYISGEELKIFTKKGFERTAFYPELKELLPLFKGKEAIIDGEIIVLNDQGKPTFHQSLIRERVRTESKVSDYARVYPVKYIAFDLLYLNGKRITSLPLAERKELLMKHLQKSSNITITDDFYDGQSLLELMKNMKWEGIVSKNSESPYISGKNHGAWFKTKLNRRLLAVVAGIHWRDALPNSLVLGAYRDGKLHYIGKASLGLKQKDFLLLKEYAKSMEAKESPFYAVRNLDHVTWLKPSLTCWVSFLEWTDIGQLRHPKIIGFHRYKPQEADGKEYTV